MAELICMLGVMRDVVEAVTEKAGPQNPSQVARQLIGSDPHCLKLMPPPLAEEMGAWKKRSSLGGSLEARELKLSI